MSYRIDYGSRIPFPAEKGSDGGRVMVLSLCFFALFALLLQAFWPEGRQVLARLLFGQGADSAAACAERILHSLREGQPLYSAAVSALRDVLHGY